ncbi:hypothetical protein AURDEDRAFT_117030, partial [Auricularia subglabra TFB-10046 SS5]
MEHRALVHLPVNLAPFALSAVCRFWREQALNVPSLWRFIAIHRPPSQTTWLLVRLMVERSRPCPLDF